MPVDPVMMLVIVYHRCPLNPSDMISDKRKGLGYFADAIAKIPPSIALTDAF